MRMLFAREDMRKYVALIFILLLLNLTGAGAVVYLRQRINAYNQENLSLKKELGKQETSLSNQKKKIKDLSSRLDQDGEIDRIQAELLTLNNDISDLDGQIIELFKNVNDHLAASVQKTSEGNQEEANTHLQEGNSAISQINNLINLSNQKIDQVNELLVKLGGGKGKEI